MLSTAIVWLGHVVSNQKFFGSKKQLPSPNRMIQTVLVHARGISWGTRMSPAEGLKQRRGQGFAEAAGHHDHHVILKRMKRQGYTVLFR